MRSPQDMQIILIDITNACTERCSNCTRFCGNHKKPFFMDYPTFQRAVDSMEGFGGLTALIGGEPTLHPEFDRFLDYIRLRYPKQERQNRLAYPQKDFIQELLHQEFESHRVAVREDGRKTFERMGMGMYSNMCASYRKYHEKIQDTLQVQFLNDHINPSYHQPGLFSRKDLGIPDEEWIPMRDACWLQNAWSATITPKGAFFCEVAAAFDMLFDGPGGWPIEPGWWKRKPEDFGDQLQWCELCGFPLKTFMRESNDEIDDVSPILYEKLKAVGSPRLKSGKTHLVKIQDGKIAEADKASGKRFAATQVYVEHYEDRFSAKGSLLYSHDYETCFIPDGPEFGEKLNAALAGAKDWLAFTERQDASAEIEELMRDCVLNPGTMHLGEGFALFSKQALSIKEYGYDRIAQLRSFEELRSIWKPEKVVYLSDTEKALAWKRGSVRQGARYAIWGMGLSGSFFADAVKTSGGILAVAVDKDEAKQQTDFYGAEVHAPRWLSEHPESYDYLLIGHYSRFDEIRREALELGVPEEKIVMPYEV